MCFPERHSKLLIALYFLIVILAAGNWRRIALKEDISVMVPNALAPAISLFQHSPLAKKIFVVVKGTSPEQARVAADLISSTLATLDPGAITAPRLDLETLLSLHQRYTPQLWDEAFQREIEPLLQDGAVAQKMRENLGILSGPEGIFMQKWITADPLHLMPVFATRLKALGAGSNLDASSGYLASPDGLRILLIFDAAGNQFDSESARKIDAALARIKPQLPPGSSAFFMGSARYTLENRQVIEKDLTRIFVVSIAVLLALFLWLFKDRRALLIYLIPPATVLIAATGTSLIFGGLSGITLGFSAVLLGMASDYCTYVYFALRGSPEDQRWNVARKLFPTITLSAVTLVLAFSLLAFSEIVLFKELATFVVIGLGVEWSVAVCIAPSLFPCCAKPETAFLVRSPFGPKTAAGIALLILLAGVLCLPLIHFNFRLDALNTVSSAFDKDRQEFEHLTGNIEQKNQFLFVFGNTKEEALQNNARLAISNPGVLPLTSLFVSEKAAAANRQRWHEFWTPERTNRLQNLIENEARNAGLKPSAFAPFFAFLRGETAGGEKLSLEAIYDPFVKTQDGRFALFNILPEGVDIQEQSGIPALRLSQNRIQEIFQHHVTHNILFIMVALLAGSAVLLTIVLKNLRHALLCLLPGLCGIALFSIVLAVSRTECNLFGFFILPMLIGIGMNYGIFIVQQQIHHSETHPSKAVIATAFSTLAGFGALIVAQHKVLFILVLGAFVGVLGAIAVSILILPALLKPKARMPGSLVTAAVLLLLLLPGCKAPSIHYAKAPTTRVLGRQVEHAGVYRGELPFRALVVRGKERCRVVILSDIGIKFIDMEVAPQSSEVYFKAGAIPQRAVGDFARFYTAWAFHEESRDLSCKGQKTSYHPGAKELLWVTTP